jgi:hypothetical protein
MTAASKVQQKAQVMAVQQLRDKYKSEYSEMYRQAVILLGGTPRQTKEEKIAKLQAEIAKLQEAK